MYYRLIEWREKTVFKKQSYVFAAFALLPGKVIALSMMTKKNINCNQMR